MNFFYYWPDYLRDTINQTKPVYKLHRDTQDILKICPGDAVWCVISVEVPGAPKHVALGAKIIAKKSGSNDSSHGDYRKYGPHYFVAARTGTEFYDVHAQVGLEALLRKLSFRVRGKHVGLSFQGSNGFRSLTDADSEVFREFASGLSIHPTIEVEMRV